MVRPFGSAAVAPLASSFPVNPLAKFLAQSLDAPESGATIPPRRHLSGAVHRRRREPKVLQLREGDPAERRGICCPEVGLKLEDVPPKIGVRVVDIRYLGGILLWLMKGDLLTTEKGH
jgi:hypothetical protein